MVILKNTSPALFAVMGAGPLPRVTLWTPAGLGIKGQERERGRDVRHKLRVRRGELGSGG